MAESRHQIVEPEGMLQKEKVEFEELLQKALMREPKKGQPVIDILEINRLRRQLLFQSYMWDHRLVYAASLQTNTFQDILGSSVAVEEKPMNLDPAESLIETSPSSQNGAQRVSLIDNTTKLREKKEDDECTIQKHLFLGRHEEIMLCFVCYLVFENGYFSQTWHQLIGHLIIRYLDRSFEIWWEESI